MDESIIITFANQKGGVGKTTLCVTFANYLVKKGLPVIVIDCDSQESLAQRRESDLKRYPSGDTAIPYEVLPFSLNKEEALHPQNTVCGNIRFSRESKTAGTRDIVRQLRLYNLSLPLRQDHHPLDRHIHRISAKAEKRHGRENERPSDSRAEPT